VQIRVRDTGVGIAPELLPRVFGLFVQADESLDRAQGGLGIGLTMVRSLVELHEGQVTASSAGIGKGSEFTIRLPAGRKGEGGRMPQARPEGTRPVAGLGTPDEKESVLADPDPLHPSSLILPRSKRRVLVVDDNRDSAETIADLLRLWGHLPHTAHDGHTALRLVEELHPEVLLLDLGLPGLDGYGVARTVRGTGHQDDLLLVAVTGYGQAADRERTAAAGFDYHLVKPVDPEELQRVLLEHSHH
jgi:CheY-like chemotaxis protein